ncbi:unnamed protein product [Closterium sp. NIES-65]|nr:unnamed protein product [Closterium sp. NIES-65]
MTSTHAPLTLRAPLDRSSAPCLRASLVPATRSAKPPPGAFVRLGGSQLTRVCRTSSHPCDRTVVRRTACPRATATRSSANAVESRAGDSGPAEGAGEREYDAVVIGAGMGGLVAATQMAVRGMRVLLLEKYLIPGGSSGWYERDGYTFDVGSSVMFGFGDQGNVNLVTRALAAVGRKLPLLEDPVAVHYHMPNGLSVQVHRGYEQFLGELMARFPHERAGIRQFYDECWTVFNALNALELQSLEEPLYLLGQFFRNPLACLTLAYYLPQNAGDIARKYITDADLLAFIDAEVPPLPHTAAAHIAPLTTPSFCCSPQPALHNLLSSFLSACPPGFRYYSHHRRLPCVPPSLCPPLPVSPPPCVPPSLCPPLPVSPPPCVFPCVPSHSLSSLRRSSRPSAPTRCGGRQCFIVSTVNAANTPMINAAMVLCDRHYGGINYPRGGVGRIAQELVAGLQERGGEVWYKANVTQLLFDHHGRAVSAGLESCVVWKRGRKATILAACTAAGATTCVTLLAAASAGRETPLSDSAGVKLSDGRTVRAKTVVSNATRWDTFGKLVPEERMPEEERQFQQRYRQAPSFLSMHLGVKADALPPGTECHHLVLESEWGRMEEPYESIFLSIPTVLDPSLAPAGRHILHVFTTAWMHDWQGMSTEEYSAKKHHVASQIIARLEKTLFPGLANAIELMDVGTPRTHRRFLNRVDGTYGPIPARRPLGLLGMPFNTTQVPGLYCVGDSCFPGQGVIAVAFSGIMCAHRVAADLGYEKRNQALDTGLSKLLAWFRTLA